MRDCDGRGQDITVWRCVLVHDEHVHRPERADISVQTRGSPKADIGVGTDSLPMSCRSRAAAVQTERVSEEQKIPSTSTKRPLTPSFGSNGGDPKRVRQSLSQPASNPSAMSSSLTTPAQQILSDRQAMELQLRIRCLVPHNFGSLKMSDVPSDAPREVRARCQLWLYVQDVVQSFRPAEPYLEAFNLFQSQWPRVQAFLKAAADDSTRSEGTGYATQESSHSIETATNACLGIRHYAPPSSPRNSAPKDSNSGNVTNTLATATNQGSSGACTSAQSVVGPRQGVQMMRVPLPEATARSAVAQGSSILYAVSAGHPMTSQLISTSGAVAHSVHPSPCASHFSSANSTPATAYPAAQQSRLTFSSPTVPSSAPAFYPQLMPASQLQAHGEVRRADRSTLSATWSNVPLSGAPELAPAALSSVAGGVVPPNQSFLTSQRPLQQQSLPAQTPIVASNFRLQP